MKNLIWFHIFTCVMEICNTKWKIYLRGTTFKCGNYFWKHFMFQRATLIYWTQKNLVTLLSVEGYIFLSIDVIYIIKIFKIQKVNRIGEETQKSLLFNDWHNLNLHDFDWLIRPYNHDFNFYFKPFIDPRIK